MEFAIMNNSQSRINKVDSIALARLQVIAWETNNRPRFYRDEQTRNKSLRIHCTDDKSQAQFIEALIAAKIDLVLTTKNGTITILYEWDSNHKSLS